MRRPRISRTFFESHLNFEKRSGNFPAIVTCFRSSERVVIPLYALYLIRRPYNREGILQTLVECIDHQDKTLDALRRNDAEAARQVSRDFLVKMKNYLGTRLVPEACGPVA